MLKKSFNNIISLLVILSLTGHLFILHPMADNSVLCKFNGEVNLEKSDLNNMCGEHNSDEFSELSIFPNKNCEDTPLFEHNDDYQPAVNKRHIKISDIELCSNIFRDTKCTASFQKEKNLSNNSNLPLLIKSTVSLLI